MVVFECDALSENLIFFDRTCPRSTILSSGIARRDRYAIGKYASCFPLFPWFLFFFCFVSFCNFFFPFFSFFFFFSVRQEQKTKSKIRIKNFAKFYRYSLTYKRRVSFPFLSFFLFFPTLSSPAPFLLSLLFFFFFFFPYFSVFRSRIVLFHS